MNLKEYLSRVRIPTPLYIINEEFMIHGNIVKPKLGLKGRWWKWITENDFNKNSEFENKLLDIYHFVWTINSCCFNNNLFYSLAGYFSVDEANIFEWEEGEFTNYDEKDWEKVVLDNKIKFSYNSRDFLDNPIDWWGEVSREELILLLQIYYWIYDDKKCKSNLEENFKAWKYNHLIWKEYDSDDRSEELREYLSYKLLQYKPSDDFKGIRIYKMFDKKWSEEEILSNIEKINKDYWKEIVTWE